MRALIRSLFFLFYHPFAWSYDLVAAAVSLGHWTEWVRATLPLIQGRRVLELGFGPGHLQVELTHREYQIFGLDESRQMVRQASHRLRGKGYPENLTRGVTQNLPFTPFFETVIATFPSEYIFDPDTIREIYRVLVPGGRLIILLSVLAGITLPPGQTATTPSGITGREAIKIHRMQKLEKITQLFEKEGFRMEITCIPRGIISLLVFSGEKPEGLMHRENSQT